MKQEFKSWVIAPKEPLRGMLERCSEGAPSGKVLGAFPFSHSFIFSFFIFISHISYSQFTLTSTITNATCPDSSNGSISIIVSGGTIPYAYTWSPGGEVAASITGLVPGIYTLTVSDITGADSTVSYVVGPSSFADNPTITPAVCTSNGSIIIFPSGGNSPYQYAWSTGSTVLGITSASAGDYSVIITDANNCSVTFSYLIPESECFIKPDPYFTPNGDNINDGWFIANAQYFDNIHLIIFDRWGTRVYEQRGTYESWNGKSYLGIPVPVSVYYYFFYLDASDKQSQAISGAVTLMR